MAVTTEAPAGVIEMIGEGPRETRQEVHDLKTHIMEMEDRLTKRIDAGFAAVDDRFDAVDQRFDALEKLIRDSLNGHGS